MPEKGILSFIKMKMESSVKKEDIVEMLLRAGFEKSHIDSAFEYVKKTHKESHQDAAASNDFLPPLKKKDRSSRVESSSASSPSLSSVASVSGSKKIPAASSRISKLPNLPGSKASAGRAREPRDSHESIVDESERVMLEVQKGLFAGRLRRKDFVLGFLFFFSVGYVTLALSTVFLSLAAPHLWQTILDTLQSDTDNMLLMLMPVILAPITVIMLSLIARRLHNLGLSGGLSLMFLFWFVPSFSNIYSLGSLALDVALLILFVVLITVKGNPAPNMYGPLPGSRGSFFKRIFNI